jgi:hypothetical protein
VKAATLSWTTEDTISLHHIKAISYAFFAPLLVIPQKLGQRLGMRQRTPTPSQRLHTVELSCPYVMLVESDIRGGIRGILP